LLDVLVRKRPHEIREAWLEVNARGTVWRRLLGEGVGLVSPGIRDRALKVVGASRAVIPGFDLQFDAPAVGYDGARDVAFCFGKAGVETIRCAISREALEDHFGADGRDRAGRVAKFREQRPTLERILRIKYLTWPVEEAGSVLIGTDDVAALLRTPRCPSVIENARAPADGVIFTAMTCPLGRGASTARSGEGQ